MLTDWSEKLKMLVAIFTLFALLGKLAVFQSMLLSCQCK